MTNVKETNVYTKKLQQDMKEAMRNKEKEKLQTIRMVITQLKNEQIKLKVAELDKDQEEVVLNRYAKQVEDEIVEYSKVGKSTEKQENEKALILSYLPTKLTNQEIKDLVYQIVNEVGAQTMKDMGKVMAAVKDKVGNNADMGVVNTEVKALLS